MDNFYWELVTRDGTKYDIPPEAVSVVNRKMEARDAVRLSTATIPYSDIVSFRIGTKRYGQQPLLQAAARAFKEPLLNEDGSIVARWVKKSVPHREYSKHYSAIPAYHSLGEQSGMVVVAFKLPVDLIDESVLDYCNEQEVAKLTNR